jgi:hypothetical protein
MSAQTECGVNESFVRLRLEQLQSFGKQNRLMYVFDYIFRHFQRTALVSKTKFSHTNTLRDLVFQKPVKTLLKINFLIFGKNLI